MYHYTVHLESKPAALKACAGRKVLLSPALPATLPAPPRNRGPYRTPDSFSQTLERPLVLTQPYGSTVRPGARQLGRIPAVAPRRGWNICLRCSAAESCAAGAVQPRCARCPLSISDPFPGSHCRARDLSLRNVALKAVQPFGKTPCGSATVSSISSAIRIHLQDRWPGT